MTFSLEQRIQLFSSSKKDESPSNPSVSKKKQGEWRRGEKGVARGGREARNVSCIANRGFNKPPWIPDDAPLWRSQPILRYPTLLPHPFTPRLIHLLAYLSRESLNIPLFRVLTSKDVVCQLGRSSKPLDP